MFLRRSVLALITAIVAVGTVAVTAVFAAPFTGTPSPSLSPTFGTLVNFDDRAGGTPVNPHDYASVGVASIKQTEEGLGALVRDPNGQSLPNRVATALSAERGTDEDDLGWDATIRIELASPTNMIGIGLQDSRGTDTLAIYNSDGVLLESMTAPLRLNSYVGFDRGSVWDIKVLVVTLDFGAIDDLQFNPGALEQLADLQAAVEGVGPGRSLANKVEATLAAYATGDVSHACEILQAFINQVNAQSGKKISVATAKTLVADATGLRTVLGC